MINVKEYIMDAVTSHYGDDLYTQLAYKLVSDVDSGAITELEANEFISEFEESTQVDLVSYM